MIRTERATKNRVHIVYARTFAHTHTHGQIGLIEREKVTHKYRWCEEMNDNVHATNPPLIIWIYTCAVLSRQTLFSIPIFRSVSFNVDIYLPSVVIAGLTGCLYNKCIHVYVDVLNHRTRSICTRIRVACTHTRVSYHSAPSIHYIHTHTRATAWPFNVKLIPLI